MIRQRQFIIRILFSAAISCGVVALIFRLVSAGHPAAGAAQVLNAVRNVSLIAAGIYLLCQLLQGLLRALRYGVLLKAGGAQKIPSLFHLYLTTLTRNMLVDMLPARLGELSYIAMLNRGYRVKSEDCVSSLTLSVLFDFVALLLIAAVILAAPFLQQSDQKLIMISTGILLVITLAGWIALLYAPGWLSVKFQSVQFRNPVLNKVFGFLHRLAAAFTFVRKSGRLMAVTGLSLGVRVIKYAGLYFLFSGIAPSLGEHFADASPVAVIIALIAAEGTASLALLPTFMSFGTYEAGGLAALTLLGFPADISIVVMLSMHVLSQFIDYSLGGLALVVFTFSTAAPQTEDAMQTRTRRNAILAATAVLLLVCAAGAAAFTWRGIKKSGSLTPPEAGHEEKFSREEQKALREALKDLDGFIVWSSNRGGNHDIWRMDLPGGKIRALTKHPHTETYPRISPDGSKIVFCRTKIPWVSQRDPLPWDVVIADAESGKDIQVIPDGNTPTWSADGKSVYFQRSARQFVRHELESGSETMLFQGEAQIQTPDYNEDKNQLAVTLRGKQRGMVLLEDGKEQTTIGSGKGCQLAWSPGHRYLYYVDHGGQMKNAIFKQERGKSSLWLDLPLPWSHEYFPKLSPDGKVMVLGASKEGHEHDTADYEIFLWPVNQPADNTIRITHHTGNDCWPDIFIR
ncbi:MAG: lysylphosphatidylglycerol synthase domain-containing protein [Kiritimatiellia bacterium]